MKLETLDTLNDDELRAVMARTNDLLKERDEARKQTAIAQAKAVLATVKDNLAAFGVTLEDLVVGKSKGMPAVKRTKPTYRSGARYQNPASPHQVWAGHGKKPKWLVELEEKGERPNDVAEAIKG